MKNIVKFSYGFLIALLILTGCGPAKDAVPEGILPKDKMIPLMIDIQLAEAAIPINNFQGDSAKQYAADYYNYIYNRHQVEKETFDKSINYYIKHPKLLDEIYAGVIEGLSVKEAEESK